MNKRTKKTRLTIVASVTLLVLLSAATFGLLEYRGRNESSSNQDTQTNNAEQHAEIDYSPSTVEDSVISEKVKQNLSEEDTSSNPVEFSVSITRTSFNDSSVDIGAIVSGLQEATCTFSVSDGVDKATSSSEAIYSNGTLGCVDTVDTTVLKVDTSWTITTTVVSDNLETQDTKLLSYEDRQ